AGQAAALERLEVDAQVERPVRERRAHAPQVGVEDVEVDEQLGGVELVEGGGGGWGRHEKSRRGPGRGYCAGRGGEGRRGGGGGGRWAWGGGGGCARSRGRFRARPPPARQVPAGAKSWPRIRPPRPGPRGSCGRCRCSSSGCSSWGPCS